MGGFLGKILGPEGLGLTGGESDSTQSITLDPTTKALNEFKLSSLQDIASNVGGLGYLMSPRYDIYDLRQPTQNLVNRGIEMSQQPGLSPQQWYNQGRADINPSAALNSIDQWYNRSRADLNPQTSINAAQQYMQQIMYPELFGQYNLMGLGRSGGLQEATAKGASSLALPIAQQQNQNLYNLNQQYPNMILPLLQQQQQNLYGLNQQYPNVDLATRAGNLQRLGQGISFSDLSRQAGIDALNRITAGALSAFNAQPYTPSPTTSTSGSQSPGLVTALGPIAGAVAGAMIGR